jgi:tetratricopeptide (TPR) repeat protein
MSWPRIVVLLLALVTLLSYLPVTHDGFLNYDDSDYVTQNQIVRNGLTWAGIKWAFTTWHASNWHPVTWLSHMADCELFRLDAGGHHFVNVLFHTANTILLFILLLRLTGALWPCAFVAALFAWHPLHVESVAWISERKDVLSTFFALLSLLNYATYAQKNRRQHFCFALVFFALGLMSKPMLVTLPFVMLLLDYWPLQRMKGRKLEDASSQIPSFRTSTYNLLVLEKWPFFLLSAISCLITFLAQRNEAVASFAKVPLSLRFENMITAYAGYLLKMIWPVHLAVFYPLPKQIAWPVVAVSAAILIIISAVVWRERRRSPCLLVGWLWFLGTLVPVIGLVQVGDQAMADRYSYFPLIGIFCAIVFFANEKARQFQFLKMPFAVAAVSILAACLVLTENQLRYWHDSESLFRHALAISDESALAHLNLGEALQDQNKPAEALAEYREVLKLDPSRHEAYNNIARILDEQGKAQTALDYCRTAVRLDPKSAFSHNNLGLVLMELGDFNEALGEFSEATKLDANYASPRFQIGKILLKLGRAAEAMPHFREALAIEPDNYQMLIYVARVLAADENPQVRNGKDALALADEANQLTASPQAVGLDTLAMALAENGRFDEAAQAENQAVSLAAAAGQNDDVNLMQERLRLYKKSQPYRESFQK